jgi:hypothetical protein
MSLLDKITERIALSEETVKTHFSAGLKQTRDSLRIGGARYSPLIGGGSQLVASSAGRLVGWSLRESTGGAPATVTLYSGRDTGGDVVAVVQLDAGKSSNHGTPAPGVSFGDGLWCQVTGAVVGSLYFGAVD